MIDSSQLRKGNLILSPFKKIEVVTKIGYEKVWTNRGCYFSSETNPVILTQEKLLEFRAFKMKTLFNGIEVLGRFIFIWKEGYNYWYVVTRKSHEYITKIEYVHEYQNFIFTLTGEELKIE